VTATETRETLADACEVARRTAAEVDTAARFPTETFAALGAARLLGPNDPTTGRPWTLAAIQRLVTPVARACGSSGLALAMHHNILHTVVRAAETDATLARLVARADEDQPLMASATSEVGSGGDIRTSTAACTPANGPDGRSGDGLVAISKRLPQASYLDRADAVVITARRDPDAAPGDQVLALAYRPQFSAETGPWHALGMRGTASGPAALTCTIPRDQVATEPWGMLARQVMMPAAHLAWSACWLGLALAALDTARAFARTSRPKSPDLAALRRAHHADLVRGVSLLDRSIAGLAAVYDDAWQAGRELTQQEVFEFAQLRLTAGDQAVAAVLGALRAVGVAGYLEAGELSLARPVRDVLSSTVMISEDRIRSDAGLLAALLPSYQPVSARNQGA
jgi:acyl-CoA dehydrogenase